MRAPLLLLGLFASAALSAAGFDAKQAREPLPGIIALGKRENLPLSGFDAPVATRTLHAGDRLVVLFSLVEKDRVSQWLLVAAVHDGDREDKAAIPVDLRLLGPVLSSEQANASPADLKTVATSVSVRESLLTYGLGDWNLEASKLKTANRMSDRQQVNALAVHLGPVFGAMGEFLKIATHTAGVKDLLAAAIDKPSLFSVIGHVGSPANFEAKDLTFESHSLLRHLNGAEDPVFVTPISLAFFKQHCSDIEISAVESRPPVLLSSGVVEMVFHSQKRPSNWLIIRVLSAQCGGETRSAQTATPNAAPESH